jgi:phosphoribosylanthranilate isomerase
MCLFSKRLVRLKICDIKSLGFAADATLLGVDGIGMHYWSWNDGTTKGDDKKRLFRSIGKLLKRSDVSLVLLTDVPESEFILRTIESIPVSAIQLNCWVDLATLGATRKRIAKARAGLRWIGVVPASKHELSEDKRAMYVRRLSEIVDLLICDSSLKGGSGQRGDWGIAAECVATSQVPVLLAGGIRMEDMRDARRITNCAGFDIESSARSRWPGGSAVESVLAVQQIVQERDRLELDHSTRASTDS